MLLPGPEGQQMATYMGWLLHRTRGGLTAGVLFVLPSLFFLILLSWIYIAFGDQPVVAGLFYGIKPAIRSEEHTSELPSLLPISYAVFWLKTKNTERKKTNQTQHT